MAIKLLEGPMKSTHSASYQYKIREISWNDDFLSSFSNQEGLYGSPEWIHQEELMDLKDELMQHFWRIANNNLTEHQLKILDLSCKGYTQTEMSKKLQVNQSCIAKSIIGAKQVNGKTYGGSVKKLRRLMEKDPEVVKILNKIKEIKEK